MLSIKNKQEEINVEEKDMQLFNRVADEYSKKDFIASSKICRKDITLRSVKKILKEKGTLGNILDVGCGVGSQAFHLNGFYKNYVGVDYSKKLIDIGKKFTVNRQDINLVCKNIKDYNETQNYFDTVIIIGGLHHMTNIDEVFQIFRNVCKPGAHIIAVEPQRENIFIQFLRKIRMRINKNYSSDQHFYTKKEMIEILRRQKARDIEVNYSSFLTQPLAQVVLKPQFIFVPVAIILTKLESIAERIFIGPLAKLSWCLNVSCKL